MLKSKIKDLKADILKHDDSIKLLNEDNNDTLRILDLTEKELKRTRKKLKAIQEIVLPKIKVSREEVEPYTYKVDKEGYLIAS